MFFLVENVFLEYKKMKKCFIRVLELIDIRRN